MTTLRLAVTRLRRRPLVSLTSLTLLVAVLLMAGAAGTLLFNLQTLLAELQREVGLVAYLAEDAPAGRLEELARQLKALPGIDEVRPVPRHLALADLRATLGAEAPLLDELGPDLLPDSLEVIPGPAAAAAPGGLEGLARRVRAMTGVAEVSLAGQGRDSVVRLAALLSLLQVGGGGVLAAMLLLVIWIIAGIAGLGVLARTHEVRLLRLLGASDAFLARPFVAEGMLLSLGAAALAEVGLLGAIGALRAALGPDAALIGLHIELPPLWAGGAFLLVAALTGLLGGYVGAVRAVGR